MKPKSNRINGRALRWSSLIQDNHSNENDSHLDAAAFSKDISGPNAIIPPCLQSSSPVALAFSIDI